MGLFRIRGKGLHVEDTTSEVMYGKEADFVASSYSGKKLFDPFTGKALTSNGTNWIQSNETLPVGSTDYTLRHDGGDWVASSSFTNDNLGGVKIESSFIVSTLKYTNGANNALFQILDPNNFFQIQLSGQTAGGIISMFSGYFEMTGVGGASYFKKGAVGGRIKISSTNDGNTYEVPVDDTDIAPKKFVDDEIGVDATPVVRSNNPIVGANTPNANIDLLDAAIGITPTSTNIISGASSVNVNLSSLDSAVNAITTGNAWKKYGLLISADTDLNNATAGTTVASLLPLSDDEGTALVIGDFAAGNILLSQNLAGVDKIFQVYDDAGTLKVDVPGGGNAPDIQTLAAGHTFTVKYDLPDSPGSQETSAIYHYDGTNLIKIGDYDWQLADGIDMAAGYTAGSGDPSASDSIQTAIQKVDGNVDSLNTATGIAQGVADLTGIDVATNGTVSSTDTVKSALGKLSANQVDLTTLSGVAQGAVDFGTFTGTTIPDNSTNKAALQALETAVESVGSNNITVNGITTITTVDSVLVDNIADVKWNLHVREAGATGLKNRYSSTIRVNHNGNDDSDATVIDFSEYGIISTGSITGLTITIDLSGAAGSQVIRLRITSTTSVNVSVNKITQAATF